MSRDVKYPVRIALCGFAASGKSTIAPLLAAALGYSSIDTDFEITRATGQSVAEYFATHGEQAFRKREQEIIRSSLQKRNVVIALGGGALLHGPTLRLVTDTAILIYLSCSIETLAKRLNTQHDRPLVADAQQSLTVLKVRIRELLTARQEGYHMARWTISTSSRTPRETARLITRQLQAGKLN